MDSVLQWVMQHGYSGIFALLVLGIVGIPIPDELVLALGGFMVYDGKLLLLPTLAVAWLGSVCGISLSCFLGRVLGAVVVHRFGPRVGLTSAKLERVQRWFERTGRWPLALGYFLPGVRHLTAYLAGMSRLRWVAWTPGCAGEMPRAHRLAMAALAAARVLARRGWRESRRALTTTAFA